MLKLPTNFQEFLNQNFQFVESYSNGHVEIYTSPDLRIRIAADMKLFMDVSIKEKPTKDVNDWIQFCLLRSYMLSNDDYLQYTDFDKVSTFFHENFKDIISLLQKNYDDVINELAKMKKKRAKILFG